MKSKHFPLWIIIVADILILAIGLCTFAYFHHIKVLWAPFEMIEPTPLQSFELSEGMGDFSETLGVYFSQNNSTTTLSDDIPIRNFLLFPLR